MRIVTEAPGWTGRAVDCGDVVNEPMRDSTKLPKEVEEPSDKSNREEEGRSKPGNERIREGEDSFRVPGCRAARRSEERRVGKECRSRVSVYDLRKKVY